ncbi:hypothetical protein TSUD_301400 [Trifolium subterraneum]|uniref:Uncharacterized protein n=1 Tax=Trifolium subterraneum TaxID=3900 RepID=A0A2Z6NMD2_TRISU|nr:hypothetical protein TSUD_301400 [Trifolium subterraneum]
MVYGESMFENGLEQQLITLPVTAVTSLVSETVSYTRHCTGNATLTSAVMLSSSSSRHNYSDQSDLTSTAMLTSSRRNRSNRADLTSAAS